MKINFIIYLKVCIFFLFKDYYGKYFMNDNEEDFQRYQETLKSNVKEYLEIDDYIKALNKALKQKRDQKKKLQESILEAMAKFEIDNMNTKGGNLVYSKTTTKKNTRTSYSAP